MEPDKKAFSNSFSGRIKSLRERKFGPQRGSQSAAARALSISPAEWRGYEHGVLPGADRLASICTVFNCDANWLLGLQMEQEALTDRQREFLELLGNTYRLLHSFDSMQTRFLSALPQVMENPAVAQENCFQLHKISRHLASILDQTGNEDGGAENPA